MNINQAFTILKNAGDVRAARIITSKFPKMSALRVYYYAHLLRRGVPVAKIIHSKWFYGIEFYTNKNTLDPRPDTETLVDAVIKDFNGHTPRILDMGTGTGCIACALVKNIPGACADAFDISKSALNVAWKNVKKLNLNKQIKLKRANFANFKSNQKFDVIVSNPPYIKYGDKRVNNAAMFDPEIALYAKNNGLKAYEDIAKNAKNLMKMDGKIYLEIGAGQSRQVMKIFKSNGFKFERAEKDLSNIVRVLVFSI